MERKKVLILSIVVVMIGLLCVGGTYAFLTLNLTVTNGNYAANTTCFNIDYDIANVGDTSNTQITGTLFQTATPNLGLKGTVAINVNTSCDALGTGTLILMTNGSTSTTLTQTVAGHCENSLTLETLTSYTTSAACTGTNRTWVTSGSALKYAIYNGPDISANPVSVGYIKSSNIGSDLNIYNNFTVTGTKATYYIYIWLDGNLATSSYVNLPFSGYVHATVSQNE